MGTPGFIGKGYYTDHLLFGGGLGSYTISSATNFAGTISGYTTFPGLTVSGDLAVKDLTISSQLIPVIYMGPSYVTHKIRASGTITINSGGAIRGDGEIPSGGGGWVGTTGARGYGTQALWQGVAGLGGSGSGGAATSSGAGISGNPSASAYPSPSWVALGGSGGDGGTMSTNPGGAGGQCLFDYSANHYFQPSVYNDAMVFYNSIIAQAAGAPSNSVHPYYELFPYKIYGGGGGGGIGDGAGAPTTGGGAAGGGVIYVSCNKLVLNGGSITAKGQNGNIAGGGGGGVIILVANEISWPSNTSTLNASGGTTGGAAYGSEAGFDGTVLIFSNTIVGRFTGSVTKAIFDAAVVAYQKQS